MTQQNHPITPPPELVQQWREQLFSYLDPAATVAVHELSCLAAQWGAEQMWEACRSEIIDGIGTRHIISRQRRLHLVDDLGLVICPKPPTLKEQALKDVDEMLKNPGSPVYSDFDRIIAALKSIPDPS